MKNTLVMIFNLDKSEKTMTLSIPNPREDLTAAEISEAAHEVIAKKAFIVRGMELENLARAFIRTVEEKALL